MKNIVLAAAIVFAAASACAGPFGLNKGMTLDQAKKQGPFVPGKNPYVYSSEKLLKGHPDFEGYTVIITPKLGLCKVNAIGKTIVTSVYGSELDSAFQELVKAMARKYGEPGTTHDFLRSGSIWSDPKDWTMALYKKERVLASYWVAPENTNLPDAIASIAVETQMLSQSRGYITLSYEFDNFDECIAATKSLKDANL